MRKDVKFGMAVSLVVVVVAAGWYFTRGGEARQAIPLTDSQASPVGVQGGTGAGGREATVAESSSPSDSRGSVDSGVPARGTEIEFVDARTVTSPASDAAGAEEDPTDNLLSARNTPPDQAGEPTDAAAATRDSGTDAVELYTTQPGDTFAVLADVYYGHTRFAEFLSDANPGVQSVRGPLPVGVVVKLPALPDELREPVKAVQASAPTLPPSAVPVTTSATTPAAPTTGAPATGAPTTGAPTRAYTVQRGDGFFLIAKRLLGSGARWPEVFELNKELVRGNVQGLKPGMVLTLPAQ